MCYSWHQAIQTEQQTSRLMHALTACCLNAQPILIRHLSGLHGTVLLCNSVVGLKAGRARDIIHSLHAVFLYIYIYIHIHAEIARDREGGKRERERDKKKNKCTHTPTHTHTHSLSLPTSFSPCVCVYVPMYVDLHACMQALLEGSDVQRWDAYGTNGIREYDEPIIS